MFNVICKQKMTNMDSKWAISKCIATVLVCQPYWVSCSVSQKARDECRSTGSVWSDLEQTCLVSSTVKLIYIIVLVLQVKRVNYVL